MTAPTCHKCGTKAPPSRYGFGWRVSDGGRWTCPDCWRTR